VVDELSRIVRDASKEFQKIEGEALRKDFASIVAQSDEEAMEAAAAAAAAPEGQKARPGTKTPNLDQYTVNLTENARNGKVDPVFRAGRCASRA